MIHRAIAWFLPVSLIAAGHIACSGIDANPPPDAAMARPTKLDLLVVLTQGSARWTYVTKSANAVSTLVNRLVSPPDGHPLWDLHIGVATSKLDIHKVCAGNPPGMRNDATLRAPANTSQVNPPRDWPPSWASRWPPRWLYLTGDMARQIRLSDLVWFYLTEMPTDGDCNITQFTEVAVRSIDGRNKGFVRPDSLLVILLLSDREDCSTMTPALWDPKLWWWNAGGRYQYSHDLCYEAPEGLLHSVDHYVEVLRKGHPGGQILVAVVGMEGKPVWQRTPEKVSTWACQNQLLPTMRLPALVRGLNGLRDPGLQATMIEACPILERKDGAGLIPLADRMLELVSR